jgi:hypothetical protein
VRITKPGRDAKVSPIEEVDVAGRRRTNIPLQELDLHYSVNGAAEKTSTLLKDKGAKKVEGTTMLSMEDFKLFPAISSASTPPRRRQEHGEDGHVLHPGGAVRVQLHAVAAGGRRRRAAAASRSSRFPNAKRKSSPRRSIS